MQKFTVFTVILTVLVVIVVAEISVNEYLGEPEEELVSGELPEGLDFASSIETSVLSADGLSNYLGSDLKEGESEDETPTFSPTSFVGSLDLEDAPAEAAQIGGDPKVSDFEDPGYITKSASVYLREEQLLSAGFVEAYIEEEEHDNKLFKTIPVGDLLNVNIEKKAVRNADSVLAKVYVLNFGFDADIDQAYKLIKGRAGQQVAADINETNQFGQTSFYMNDARRQDIAFLVVKLPNLIYAFSYPKDYHSQVKNLIQLIEWELG